jgi:hypothetical protein
MGELVLSIYPFSRGFGFVLFEGAESPFDWGVREIKEKNRNVRSVDAIKELIDRYRPEILLIEDVEDSTCRRSPRIKKLYQMLSHLAAAEYVDLCKVREITVRKYFLSVGAVTKYERALAIGRQIPAFGHRIPRVRKAWMSADPRQSLFDAAALGLVFYGTRGVVSPYNINSN